ncbi:MAG: proton-conducting transporter membrane subunit [Brachybacterium sp.]|nr:proton-conducting transporter membrane subunit [Brachybacterium sp.]
MVTSWIPDAALSWVPAIMLLISLGTAVAIFPMREQQERLRAVVNLIGAVAKLLLVISLVPLVVRADVQPEFAMPFLPGVDLVLRVDSMAIFFAGLSALLWLLTTIYAIGYMRSRTHRSRFFGFFSLCVTATVGISFSGNLITFLVFYELLTLVTYPLVAHYGNPASLRAARVYLRYALTGGLAVLIGVVWLTIYAGQVDFAPGGADGVTSLAAQSPVIAIIIFALLVGGMGVKAAIVPLHGWLPKAMVAPAPVSALLHAVAVVKAGVFGIIRVIDDVYGIEVARELGVLTPLLVLAAITIVFGSVKALSQKDLKARLAYSTVSQVSYVTLGISLATVTGTTGGIVHLVHQGITKITLFFAAGLFADVLGAKTIDQLEGAGRRMPWTSLAFTIGAFGMIGLPPTAGFVSKWQLGLGALESPHPWVVGVLLTSSLLNAMYFLPVVYRIWLLPAPDVDPDDLVHPASDRLREPRLLMLPAMFTATLALVAGFAASADFMPLYVARQIATAVFDR